MICAILNCAYAFQLSGNDIETFAHYKNVQ